MKSEKIVDTEMLDKLGIESSGNRGKKWKWIIFVVLLIIIAAVIIVSRNKPDKGTTSHFKTNAVATGPLTVTVSATGTLKPTNTVEVGSELSGNVNTVEAQYNDSVKKGQVLVTLDGSNYEAQVLQSKAALESAQAQVLNAEATEKENQSSLDRMKQVWELSGNKVPSKTEIDSAEAALARAKASVSSAKAAVSQAEATLKENQTNISKLTIRSPVDGIVLTRDIEPGQTVQASFQGVTLFTLAEDLSMMELHVNVDEADVGEVKKDQDATFTVDAYPDRTFNARITQVRYGSTTVSGVVTYETVLDVENKDLKLRPGMTATAEIVVNKLEKATLIQNASLRYIPTEKELAAYSGQKKNFFEKIFSRSQKTQTEEKTVATDKKEKKVWMLQNNILKSITITTGLTDGTLTEVTGGDLKPGTLLIIGTESEEK